jgi:multiple sugar transport system permease protein
MVAVRNVARRGRRLPTVRTLFSQGLVHAILIAMSVIAIFPFVWMTFASFKPFKELVESKTLLPQTWTLRNYAEILSRVNFFDAFRNSVVAAVSVTVAAVFTSSVLGYIFSKYRFPGKEILFTIILSTMMVPFAVVMVPLYITIADFGLADRLGGIIVTGFFSTFGIFMMRQFMESIPFELIDAARIDGASEWRIFFTLVLPMSLSPMSALAVFVFLGNWDSYMWPLIVLNSLAKQTLPLVLAGLRNLWWTRYEMWSAGSMLTVVPIMIVYSFASKYFIRGIAMTGLKA